MKTLKDVKVGETCTVARLHGEEMCIRDRQNAQMALSVADRAYVLETGHVVMDGTGAELLTNCLLYTSRCV